MALTPSALIFKKSPQRRYGSGKTWETKFDGKALIGIKDSRVHAKQLKDIYEEGLRYAGDYSSFSEKYGFYPDSKVKLPERYQVWANIMYQS